MAARCQIELQPPGEASAFQDPAALLDAILEEPRVNQELVRRVLLTLDLPVSLQNKDVIDTRIHDEIPLRLILESQRVLMTFDLPKGSGEDLPELLDAIFELCFSLAGELGLDVYDPQAGQVIAPSQYERRFSLLLDAYRRRHQIAEALSRMETWTEVPKGAVDPGIRETAVDAPILRVPREVLPSRRRALRGRFGPIEVSGESGARALQQALDDNFVLALVADSEDIQKGTEAQLARILRYYAVAPGEWLVELQGLGLRKIQAVRRRSRWSPVQWASVTPVQRTT